MIVPLHLLSAMQLCGMENQRPSLSKVLQWPRLVTGICQCFDSLLDHTICQNEVAAIREGQRQTAGQLIFLISGESGWTGSVKSTGTVPITHLRKCEPMPSTIVRIVQKFTYDRSNQVHAGLRPNRAVVQERSFRRRGRDKVLEPAAHQAEPENCNHGETHTSLSR